MTAAQSLKIYDILGRHFNNIEDARIVVTEIEEIIETKIVEKKDTLATKEDIGFLKNEMIKLREDSLKLQIDMEKRFNQLTIWIVGTSFALAGIVIAVVKL